MSGTKSCGIAGKIPFKSKEASTNKEMMIVARAFNIAAHAQVKTANEVVASQNKIAIKRAKEIAARVYRAQV